MTSTLTERLSALATQLEDAERMPYESNEDFLTTLRRVAENVKRELRLEAMCQKQREVCHVN